MKYYIHCSNGYQEVDGTPVIIKGFEDFDFFIHKVFNDDKRFTISEAKTGLGFGIAAKNTELVVKEATEKLTKLGTNVLLNILEKTLAKPDYRSPLFDTQKRTITLPEDIHLAITKRISKNHDNYSEYLFKILRHELLRKHSKK